MPEKNIAPDAPASLSGIVNITYLSRDNCTITEKNGFIGLRAVVDKPDDWTPPSESDKKAPPAPENHAGDFPPPPPDGMGGPPPAGMPPVGMPPPDAAPAPENKEGSDKDKKPEKRAVEEKLLENGKLEKTADRIFLSRAFPFDMPCEYISVLDRDKKEIGFIRSLDDFDEPSRSLLRHELEAKYYTPKIKRILSVKERYGFSYWKVECDFGEKSFTLQDTFRSIIKANLADGSERVFILDVDGNRYEIVNVEALDRQSYKKIELYL